MAGSATPLRLHVADTFLLRLLGAHVRGLSGSHEGLLLRPCNAIHTLFLRAPIDVVFLDRKWRECRHIPCMPPQRAAREAAAHMVVELPAGYCARHPDYLLRIHAALRLREIPRLSA